MAPAVRARVLGCPVDVVDMAGAVAQLVTLVEEGRSLPRPGLVVTLNPEMIMRARRDPRFHGLLEDAALLVPDGIGLVRALRRRGHRGAVRVGGADLLDRYLGEAERRGHRLALAGGGPGVAAAAAMTLTRRHPSLQVCAHGGDPDAATATALASAAPDLVLAAYGAGRQEAFLHDHLVAIGAAAGVGVGGTLDFWAGRARRAPPLLRRAGLEWAWRLVTEPRRWRRQLVLPAYWWLERREVRG